MFGILDAIEDWLRQLLISIISSNLTTLFDDVNTKVGTIATEVGQTPSGWNSSIYNMVHSLSENVMVPIAGIIITFVLCYELITVITEKNNMHDIDTFLFFKYIFKACIAVYLVSNTFTITMAVFDVAQNVVNHAGGIISGNTNIDITSTMSGAAVLPPPALTAAALFPMYLPIPASTTWDDVPRRASMISVPLSAPRMQSQVTLSSLLGLTTADVLSAMSASMSATGK